MADNSFEILIKYGLDSTKAKEAARELEKVKDAAKDVGKESEKASEKGSNAASKHTEKIEGLHRATGMLFRQFGELGHLLHSLVSPEALGVAALSILVAKLGEWFRGLGEEVEKFAKRMDAVALVKLNAARDAASSMTVEMRKLNDEMQHAGEKADPLHSRKFADEKTERMARFGLQDDLERVANEKAQAAADLKNNPELIDANARLADAKNQEAELIEKERKSRETVEAYKKQFGEKIGQSDSEAGAFYRGAVAAHAAASEALAGNRLQQGRYRSTIDMYGRNQVSADREAAQAKAAAIFNRTRIGDLNDSIGATEAAGLSATANRSFDEAQGIAKRISGGGSATQAEQNLLRSVASNIAGQNLPLDTAVKMMEQSQRNRDSLLERLIKAMETFGGVGVGLERRIRDLEQKTNQMIAHP